MYQAASAQETEAGPVKHYLQAIQDYVADFVDLASEEFRLATLSFFTILMLLIFVAAATVICWGLVVAAVVAAVATTGLSWAVIALILAALHAAIALIFWQVVMRLSRNLSLPELRSALSDQPHS